MTTAVSVTNHGPGDITVGGRTLKPGETARDMHVWHDGVGIHIDERNPEVPERYTPTAYADRVLVEDPEHISTSAGGIFVVGGKAVDVVCSRIVSVGPAVKDKDLKPGDRVLHTKKCGVAWDSYTTTGMKRGHYRFMQEKEIFAVLAPEAVFEGGTGFYDDDGKHYTEKS